MPASFFCRKIIDSTFLFIYLYYEQGVSIFFSFPFLSLFGSSLIAYLTLHKASKWSKSKKSMKNGLCRLISSLFLSFFLFVLSPIATSQSQAASKEIPQGLVQFGVPYYSPTLLVVDKEKRQVSIWQNLQGRTQKVLTLNSNVGKKQGDKLKEGDFKTPEGIYFFIQQFMGKELPSYELYGTLAFNTDYPNFFDRRKGKTGTGIWLHGFPNHQPFKEGSRGCVILYDEDIHSLRAHVQLYRTPMLIYDSVPMAHPSNVQRLRVKINQMITKWKTHWENKQISAYMGFYHSQFQSQKKNWDKWKAYKKRLMAQYQFIQLNLTKPLILHHPSGVIVKTLQRYVSNAYSDFGEKTLYLAEEEGEFKIIGEYWRALDENPTLYFSATAQNKEGKRSLTLNPSSVQPKPLRGLSIRINTNK